MPSDNAIAALTLLFIAGLVWLRTRMHYQRAHTRLAVSRAGWIYFAGLALLLGAGWVAAPAALRALWPGPLVTPLLARVVSFLATYFLFIPVHQALKAQGYAVFRPRTSAEAARARRNRAPARSRPARSRAPPGPLRASRRPATS